MTLYDELAIMDVCMKLMTWIRKQMTKSSTLIRLTSGKLAEHIRQDNTKLLSWLLKIRCFRDNTFFTLRGICKKKKQLLWFLWYLGERFGKVQAVLKCQTSHGVNSNLSSINWGIQVWCLNHTAAAMQPQVDCCGMSERSFPLTLVLTTFFYIRLVGVGSDFIFDVCRPLWSRWLRLSNVLSRTYTQCTF